MKKIVYYISDNGFGHASRGIGLIRELAKYDDLQIIVKTGRPLEFIKTSLKNTSNIEFVYSKNDVGLVLKENSLQVNKSRLKEKLNTWVDNWDELVSREESLLANNEVDLIISDITPWPLLVGKNLGIKTVGISNFTWYEIYRDLLGLPPAVRKIKNAYEQTDIFFKLPLNLEIKTVSNLQEVGFISRKIDNKEVKEIRRKIGIDKKLVYIGIGKSVDLRMLNELNIQRFNEYNFLFSSGVDLQGDNIYIIPESVTETQNYIAACDYVITKPGWSTATEAILADVPLLLINRNEIIEDKKVSQKIQSLDLGLSISQQEFEDLDFEAELKKLNTRRENFRGYCNQVGEVAEKIISLV